METRSLTSLFTLASWELARLWAWLVCLFGRDGEAIRKRKKTDLLSAYKGGPTTLQKRLRIGKNGPCLFKQIKQHSTSISRF